MECKEFEKQIPDFIGKKLDYVALKAFAEHVESCPKCGEELTIQFLIDEGLVRLEEGSAFDLKTELWTRMNEAEKKIRRNDRIVVIGAVFEYIAMAAVAAVVISIIFM